MRCYACCKKLNTIHETSIQSVSGHYICYGKVFCVDCWENGECRRSLAEEVDSDKEDSVDNPTNG